MYDMVIMNLFKNIKMRVLLLLMAYSNCRCEKGFVYMVVCKTF